MVTYEEHIANARRFEDEGDIRRAAITYSAAGESAFKIGIDFASYRCYRRAAQLTDKLIAEQGLEEGLLMDSVHQHVFAGRTAIKLHRKKYQTMRKEERELWWERAVGQFADAKASMKKLMERGVSLDRIGGLFTEGLEKINDPIVAKMLAIEKTVGKRETVKAR